VIPPLYPLSLLNYSSAFAFPYSFSIKHVYVCKNVIEISAAIALYLWIDEKKLTSFLYATHEHVMSPFI
jgi:hypothetical protein